MLQPLSLTRAAVRVAQHAAAATVRSRIVNALSAARACYDRCVHHRTLAYLPVAFFAFRLHVNAS